MLGYKWEHKLQKWVVYLKDTSKIIDKFDSEHDAKRALSRLRSTGEEERLSKRKSH